MSDQQGDVRLCQTNDDGEIEVIGGLVTMDGGMATAAYLALFGGNERDDGGDASKLQYWGNLNESNPLGRYRSLTQNLLRSIPSTVHNLRRIEEAARKDLSFFLAGSIAGTLDVGVTMPGLNTVNVAVSIEVDGKRENFNFTENWGASRGTDDAPKQHI